MDPAIICFIILGITIVVLIAEAVPVFAVGLLLPVICYACGFVNGTEAIAKLANSVLVSTGCIYIVSNAFFQVGLADKIGRGVLTLTKKLKFKDTERGITVLLIVVLALMCLVLPRYGVTASFIPVVCAIAMYTGVSRTRLLMLLAMTVNFAGGSTTIATIPNLYANNFLESIGLEKFGFFEFAWIGVPITILGAIIYVLFGKKLLPPARIDEAKMREEEGIVEGEDKFKDVPKWKIVITIISYGLFVVGMMFEKQWPNWIGVEIPSHVIALLAAGLIVATGVTTSKDAVRSVSWGPLIFSYGVLTLTTAMSNTGATAMFGDIAVKLMGSNPSPTVVAAVFFLISVVMTQFMSNTTACNMMFPIGAAVAEQIGADPTAIIMTICVACSASFMTPTATQSNLIVLEPGDIHYKDFIKAGWPIMLVSMVCCLVICPMLWPYF